MSRVALFWKKKEIYVFFEAATEKKSSEALIFQLPQYESDIIEADTKEVYDPGGFLSVIATMSWWH